MKLDTADTAGLTTVGSAATSVTMFGMSISELAAIVSGVVAVLSFCVHLWATYRRDKREQEAHQRDQNDA